MNKVWLLISIFLVSISIVGCKKSPTNTNAAAQITPEQYQQWLLGTWKGNDSNGDIGNFSFHENGSAILYLRGEELPLQFQLDSTTNPMELDFIMPLPDGQERRLLLIIQFNSQDQILIRTFFSENRPTRFLEEGETEEKESTIVLNRIQ